MSDLVQAYNKFIQYLDYNTEYDLIQLDRDDTNFKIQDLREAIEAFLEHKDPATGKAYKNKLPYLERL